MHSQGVIQDFEVEGGNEKSNQKMLLKKSSTVISILSYEHSVIIERGGGIGARGGYPPFPPLHDTLTVTIGNAEMFCKHLFSKTTNIAQVTLHPTTYLMIPLESQNQTYHTSREWYKEHDTQKSAF